MNRSIIRYILGSVLKVEAAFMLLPCIVALCYMEKEGVVYLGVGIVTFLLGMLMTHKKANSSVFYLKEGCVATALSWIFMSFFGCIPFILTGEIPSLIDALFETVSGFTTTGASILSDVEVLSHCTLMWRSFTHWIGGMGVLVFLLCLLPLTGSGYHMNLMKAESPGPSVTKLVPKVQSTAKILYGLYLFLTVLEFILLLVGQMPVFDSLCTVFGTAGTGGFGIKNDSFGSYSTYLQGVVTVFMILFGINFNVYFLFYMKKPKEALRCEEARWYLGIIAASILVITFFVRDFFDSLFLAFHHVAFQVASIITTTGFATVDFNLWPTIPKTILVLLMFIGACAGSTGGGLKIGRTLLLLKNLRRKTRRILNPKRVEVVRVNGQKVSESVLENTNTYLIAYVVIVLGSFLLISIDNLSMMTNFSAVVACFNNIGPGFDAVGPTCNFSVFSGFSKVVLIFDMLAGRLEVFPLLLLFKRDTWRKF